MDRRSWPMVPLSILALFGGLALLPSVLYPDAHADLMAHELSNTRLAPLSLSGSGEQIFLLGTDGQGRDMLALVLFGWRQSLGIAVGAVILAMVLGSGLGLAAGYLGGWVSTVVLRTSDVQSAVPCLVFAMMLAGIVRGATSPNDYDALAPWLMVLAIGLSEWVVFARLVRTSVLAEKQKAYVTSATAIGARPTRILLKHILPNILSPIFAVAKLSLPAAVIVEATLSFLGVGLPATQPSLGTLIARGQSDLHSGAWWTLAFPAMLLVAFSLTVHAVGRRPQ